MSEAGLERELKFSVMDDPPSPAELEAISQDGPFRFVEAGVSLHADRYFDDPAGSLAAAGLSLRQRRRSGEATLATVKTLGETRVLEGSAGALHLREELEAPMVGDDWPVAIARRLTAHVALYQLRPLLDLETLRSDYHVLHQGRPVALLSFDRVSARKIGSEREALFGEVEIEAREGTSERLLLEAAELVGTLVRLNPSGVSKLRRAEALLSLAAEL